VIAATVTLGGGPLATAEAIAAPLSGPGSAVL
jgi:hypothetical protein